jgi:hypothetical protein
MPDLGLVEPSPRLDASRPTFLRLAGFLLTLVGAVVIGVGAGRVTWVTQGIRGAEIVSPSIPGTDTPDGRLALVSAVVMLVAVLLSRLLHTPTARKTAAAIVIACGILCVALSGAFLLTASSRYEWFESERLSEALGVSEAELAAMLRAEGVVGFTELGTGPYLVLLGGALGTLGGILVLAWASRTESPSPVRETPQALTALF